MSFFCPRCKRHILTNVPFCSCGFDLLYGSTKKKKTGKCIYCNLTGKLSKEHVYGDWLRKKYIKPSTVIRHSLGRPSLVHPDKSGMIYNIENSIEVQPYSDKVFNVCKACNNNWMSQIHKDAFPIVSILADGFWPKFSENDIFALSRWVAMIVINLESLSRIEVITHNQKTELMTGKIPKGWRISAGRMYDSDSGGHSFQRSLCPSINDDDNAIKVQATYFCIEKVAFHAISAPNDIMLGFLKYEGIPEQFLPRRIWPICDDPTIATKKKL